MRWVRREGRSENEKEEKREVIPCRSSSVFSPAAQPLILLQDHCLAAAHRASEEQERTRAASPASPRPASSRWRVCGTVRMPSVGETISKLKYINRVRGKK